VGGKPENGFSLAKKLNDQARNLGAIGGKGSSNDRKKGTNRMASLKKGNGLGTGKQSEFGGCYLLREGKCKKARGSGKHSRKNPGVANL